MSIRCRVCNKPSVSCEDCDSTASEAGQLEIVWNGYIAMTITVLVCRTCDGAWLQLSEKTRSFVCRACRRRALRVEIRPAERAGELFSHRPQTRGAA